MNLDKFNNLAPEKLTGTEYMWQFQGKKGAGNTITVLGGLHGNEAIGVEVVHKLIHLAQHCVKKGVLNLGIGNPKACKIDERFVQKDGNRLFTLNNQSIDGKRTTQLEPFTATSNVLFDIHSTIQPTRPFLIIPEMRHALAGCIPRLGISTIITGPGLIPPCGRAIESDLFCVSHKGLGITIEADPRGEKATKQIVNSIVRALKHLGIFDPNMPGTEDAQDEFTNLEILTVHDYMTGGPDFEFAKPWKNFDDIEIGDIIAYENGIPIRATKKCKIVFPKAKKDMVAGNQVCLLVEAKSALQAVVEGAGALAKETLNPSSRSGSKSR